MKRLMFVVLLGMGGSLNAEFVPDVVGQYTIVTGVASVGQDTSNVIIKLDTATGQTWVLYPIIVEKGMTTVWMPLDTLKKTLLPLVEPKP